MLKAGLAAAIPCSIAAGVVVIACAVCAPGCGLSSVGIGGGDVGGPDDAASGADGTVGVADGAVGFDGASPDASASADGSTPDGGFALDAGLDGSVDPYTTRVATDLVALYAFEDGSGSTAHDAIATAYDLTIDDTKKTTWHAHSLEFTDYTDLSGTGNFQKLITAVATSHAVTVEAWVKITNVTGSGNYGRLVSLIQDSNTRDIDMGVHSNSYWASMLSSNTLIEKGNVPSGVAHLVVTNTKVDGILRMYLNGAPFSTANGVSDPGGFVAYQLFVMNSKDGDRGMLGDIHLLAFYDVALTDLQVMTNYLAGPDPAK